MLGYLTMRRSAKMKASFDVGIGKLSDSKNDLKEERGLLMGKKHYQRLVKKYTKRVAKAGQKRQGEVISEAKKDPSVFKIEGGGRTEPLRREKKTSRNPLGG